MLSYLTLFSWKIKVVGVNLVSVKEDSMCNFRLNLDGIQTFSFMFYFRKKENYPIDKPFGTLSQCNLWTEVKEILFLSLQKDAVHIFGKEDRLNLLFVHINWVTIVCDIQLICFLKRGNQFYDNFPKPLSNKLLDIRTVYNPYSVRLRFSSLILLKLQKFSVHYLENTRNFRIQICLSYHFKVAATTVWNIIMIV